MTEKCPCNECSKKCSGTSNCQEYRKWRGLCLLNDFDTLPPSEEEIEEMRKLFLAQIEAEKTNIEENLSTIKVKCKPCYDFQSIEFDYNLKADLSNLIQLEGFYTALVQTLARIAEKNPNPSKFPAKKEKPKPTEPLATDAQKGIMEKFNIPFDENTTKKQATALIQKSIENC